MTNAVKRLLSKALKLSAEDRHALLEELVIAISAEPERGVSQDEVDRAWKKEIRRRVREIESGMVKLVPWEVARRELFKTPDRSKGPARIRRRCNR